MLLDSLQLDTFHAMTGDLILQVFSGTTTNIFALVGAQTLTTGGLGLEGNGGSDKVLLSLKSLGLLHPSVFLVLTVNLYLLLGCILCTRACYDSI